MSDIERDHLYTERCITMGGVARQRAAWLLVQSAC